MEETSWQKVHVFILHLSSYCLRDLLFYECQSGPVQVMEAKHGFKQSVNELLAKLLQDLEKSLCAEYLLLLSYVAELTH